MPAPSTSGSGSGAFDFTPDQRRWYESLVPEVPERAVDKLLGAGRRDARDDLLQEAHLGVAYAVTAFDPSKGSLRPWAYFHARYAALELLDRERSHALMRRRVRAAALDQADRVVVPDVLSTTDERDHAAFAEAADAMAAAAVVALASFKPPAGEEALVEREAATRCAAALKDAIGELSVERRELLRRCFGDGLTIRELTAVRAQKGYRRELVEFHKVVDIVGARLRGKGFRELPPFPEEAGGTILREE